jgi:hypothetical protein
LRTKLITLLTDAGVKELVALTSLTWLDLHARNVTDAGFNELGALKNLTQLHLNRAKITDAGLKGIVTLPKLAQLTLSYTSITDAGLSELAALKGLTKLLCRRSADRANSPTPFSPFRGQTFGKGDTLRELGMGRVTLQDQTECGFAVSSNDITPWGSLLLTGMLTVFTPHSSDPGNW